MYSSEVSGRYSSTVRHELQKEYWNYTHGSANIIAIAMPIENSVLKGSSICYVNLIVCV
jgi:hypothetical protein